MPSAHRSLHVNVVRPSKLTIHVLTTVSFFETMLFEVLRPGVDVDTAMFRTRYALARMMDISLVLA